MKNKVGVETMNRQRPSLTLMTLLLTWVGCASPVEPPPIQGVSILAVFSEVVDETIVPGGALIIDTDGAALLDPRQVTVRFDGFIAGRQTQNILTASHTLDNQTIRIQVPWSELQVMVGAERDVNFQGNLIIRIDDVTGEVAGEGTVR